MNKAVIEPPAVELKRFQPVKPAALVLEDEQFARCPNEDPSVFVCMDMPNARKVIRNKAKTIVWVKDANAIIDFYAAEDSSVTGK